MVPSPQRSEDSRPARLCVKHGSGATHAGPGSEVPAEVVRKIALLCAQQFIPHPTGDDAIDVVVRPAERQDANSGWNEPWGQIVEVAVLRGTVDDELRAGAAITSLIHHTLRSTGAIRSVRVTFG